LLKVMLNTIKQTKHNHGYLHNLNLWRFIWFNKYGLYCCRRSVCFSGFDLATIVVIGTDCICSYKSNYHTITTTMAPVGTHAI
jgi:hypothetical protein